METIKNTEIFKITKENKTDKTAKLKKAAEFLARGELVAIPTETVYGLGANALCASAVRSIYEVKGRPSDNPLIIHIADAGDLSKYVRDIPDNAKKLTDIYWPGPLTIILPKKDIISNAVSGNLDSVAVRCPAQDTARELIKICGFPIAAPSANLSGKPSPTSAVHVLDDMNGRIAGIIDDGECEVGVESTIVSFLGKVPKILRPGGITPRDIEEAIGEVEIDKSIFEGLGEDEKPLAPGMKYKHYAPHASLFLIKGGIADVTRYMREHNGDNVGFIIFNENKNMINNKNIHSIGSADDDKLQAHRVFDILRGFDKNPQIDTIYSVCPKASGIGLAVYNRLIKAAGFNIINV